MIEALKQALTDAKRNERHNNVAETRYWFNQYKLIAEQAIAELESQEPVAIVTGDAWETDIRFLPEGMALPPDTKLYTHPPQRTEPVALPCCGYTDAGAVKWNPLNGVVQCHNCGQNYTTPQRTWVGLAAEDRLTAKYMQDAPDGIEAVIDYIEAKLKEKNT